MDGVQPRQEAKERSHVLFPLMLSLPSHAPRSQQAPAIAASSGGRRKLRIGVEVSSSREGAAGVLDIANHMATTNDQVVKCLNTSTSRKHKRFTFKTFSQRVDEIDIDEFHSLQPLKPDPKDGSSFFREALLYWKELNTAEDFILFYEMIMPLVQKLPQIILHKEHIFSELVGRLQMRAKQSLEPLLMSRLFHE